MFMEELWGLLSFQSDQIRGLAQQSAKQMLALASGDGRNEHVERKEQQRQGATTFLVAVLA